MNKLGVSVLAVLLVLSAVVNFRQLQSNAKLQTQLSTLEAEMAARDARLKSTSNVSQANVDVPNIAQQASTAEIARLKNELAAAKKNVSQAKLTQTEGTPAAKPLAITPVGELKNAGLGTPSLALQTMVWAASGGDVDALTKAIALDPDGQAKANALFDRLPDAAKAQYGSPDRLTAFIIAKDVSAVSGMQVTSENISGDNARVSVLFQNAEGGMKEDTFRFHQGSEGWQLLVSGRAVDRFERSMGSGK